jgi:peptidoglycan/LPS O-acetylase OafA/YrhL
VFFPVFDTAGPIDNLAFLILASAAALVVSGVTYNFFEKPIVLRARATRRRLFAPPEAGHS